jgi:AcrR family transcriptional regulator
LGPRERREREREEIRTRILDAARELFAAEGVEAVTMRRIADRIEYSPTAIYFHFRDKEALLAELCDCDFRVFAQQFIEIAKIPDPVARLKAAGTAYVNFGLSHPSHYRVMFMTPKAAESKTIEKGNPEEDAYAFLRGIVTELIAKDLVSGETDPDLVAQVIWSAMHGLVSLEIAKCNDTWVDWRPVEARARLVVEMILRGLLIEEGRGQRAEGRGPAQPGSAAAANAPLGPSE